MTDVVVANPILREHVTSTAFSLTLTKRQMDLLILLHHYRGNFDKAHNHTIKAWQKTRGGAAAPLAPLWVSNGQSLASRGLISPKFRNWTLTKAGKLVIGLLQEAGIYDERLADLELKAAA